MRYHALACDYDGTIAHHGKVCEDLLAALERLRSTGRKLILVTGRELDELLGIFAEIDLFDQVVAENGALLYHPGTRETKLLADAPDERFLGELRRRGVAPLAVGRAIVATWKPHETAVLETIRDQALDLQVIFNKDAVMVLPAGVNKASGLQAALTALELTTHEIVGVGDAENDQAFLSLCECSAAVANALPSVKERVDLVLKGDHGVGVAELIDQIVKDDLGELEPRLTRHHLLVGHDRQGQEVRMPPRGLNLLIAGPSGSGKSTAATGLLERLAERHYQYCIMDPEGDYEGLEGALVLGAGGRPPSADEVMKLLEEPDRNVVVNMIGLPLADRPPFFLGLLPRLMEMRARTGRPHWLLIDEAHHLLPASWEPGPLVFPRELKRAAFLTVHPDQVAPGALASVDTVIAVGHSPAETIGAFCKTIKEHCPAVPEAGENEVILWTRGSSPLAVKPVPGRTERRRHVRKYAEGELPPDRSFYFRGSDNKLELRAQNLILFMQIGEGVDDETWQFHLRAGDYSDWFRTRIKDDELADEAKEIESDNLDPAASRQRIREAIEKRYTLPASGPLPMPGTDEAPRRQKETS